MCKPLVYLAGPITGVGSPENGDWRAYCREKLAPDISVLSPTRQHIEVIDETGDLTCEQQLRLMQHGRQIVARDRSDVMRCNLLLLNLLGSTKISIGSVGEVFWADAYRKPVIIVREPRNIHTHAMLDALAGWIYNTLDEALEVSISLLSAI